MPIFEFSCRKCGHRFEELMTAAELEAAKPRCPECASKQTERGFSAFATGGSDSAGGFAGGGGGCGPGGFT